MLKQLEEMLDLFFGKKVPALPKSIKEIIVNYSPWAALISSITGIPTVIIAVVVMLGVGVFSLTSIIDIISMILLGTAIVLVAAAIPGLFKRTKRGWYFVYYSIVLAVVASLITLSILNSLITVLVGLYFLFQVKEYYT